MKIKYRFCDDTVQEVEVDEKLYAAIQEIEQYERRQCWRDAKYRFMVDSLENFLEKNDIDIEDAGSDPQCLFIRYEDNALVHNAIARLSNSQRRLVKKVFFEEMTITAVAAQQHVSQQAISKKMAVIYKKLKKLL